MASHLRSYNGIPGPSPSPSPDDGEDRQRDNQEVDDYRPHSSSRRFDPGIEKSLVLKLDTILLPFLSLLFLINSLDRSNIGNAETAHFTRDAGLDASDLNIAVAVMYAFFVSMQPVGAALGRKVGMSRWVPATMALWGLCTVLHCWVRTRWALVTLRGVIGCLEAGFYPTTVSYLSLFYTRYEFGRRLALFYGSAGVAGALGGVLAFAIFSESNLESSGPLETTWKPWQFLFLVEGGFTILIALVGFFVLPHDARTAWFLTPEERICAEERVRRDRENPENEGVDVGDVNEMDEERRLLDPNPSEGNGYGRTRARERGSRNVDWRPESDAQEEREERDQDMHLGPSLTKDSGLPRHDIMSTILFLPMALPVLLLNILSAIPATAFSVFLPLVISSMDLSSPLYSNLLTAPPFLLASITLFLFSWRSDKTHQRLNPIMWSLGVIMVGLVLTMSISTVKNTRSTVRSAFIYTSLCIMLSGSYIPSPLTVTWLSGNIPSPGKRAIILGINGLGNLAGVFSSLLFSPAFKPQMYRLPLGITLLSVCLALGGFLLLRSYILRVNIARAKLAAWHALEAEEHEDLSQREIWVRTLKHAPKWSIVGGAKWDCWVRQWIGCKLLRLSSEEAFTKRGDEEVTFEYEL